MDAFIFLGGIAFIAGIIARSLFVAERQPQVIYIRTEPQERGGGCLPLVLLGAGVLVLLTVSGA